MTTHDPATRHNCEHCAEGVPLNPDGLMHTHTGSDGWHAKGHESPCFSDEAYELVKARRAERARELVIVDGSSSLVRETTEALRRAGRPMEIVSVPERSGDTLARIVDRALEVAPIVFRASRRVNEPFRNVGYFADTPNRRRGRR